jgi:hypothetical protein
MTATGLVVTDLSHLDVGLDIRGDFRGLVRFAVSSTSGDARSRDALCRVGSPVRSVIKMKLHPQT